jgi:signal peptidase I
MRMNANELFYTGESMRGMFRPGDRLVFEPVTLSDLQPGDVVVYRKPRPGRPGQNGNNVVHRVIAITSEGVILRGDNNTPADVEWVLPHYIVGRVTHFIRDGTERRMRGGLLGLLAARITYRLHHLPRQVRQRGRNMLRPLLRVPYRLLRRSRIVAFIWRPAIKQVTVQTTAGPLVKYVHRGRTVIEWWPERGLYHAVRPYDLIIFPPDSTTFPSELTRIDDP